MTPSARTRVERGPERRGPDRRESWIVAFAWKGEPRRQSMGRRSGSDRRQADQRQGPAERRVRKDRECMRYRVFNGGRPRDGVADRRRVSSSAPSVPQGAGEAVREGWPVPAGWAVESVKRGSAWLDGDHFCPGDDPENGPMCPDSASYLFVPVCKHDPEPEVTIGTLMVPRQFAALLVTLRPANTPPPTAEANPVAPSETEGGSEAPACPWDGPFTVEDDSDRIGAYFTVRAGKRFVLSCTGEGARERADAIAHALNQTYGGAKT